MMGRYLYGAEDVWCAVVFWGGGRLAVYAVRAYVVFCL